MGETLRWLNILMDRVMLMEADSNKYSQQRHNDIQHTQWHMNFIFSQNQKTFIL